MRGAYYMDEPGILTPLENSWLRYCLIPAGYTNISFPLTDLYECKSTSLVSLDIITIVMSHD